MNSHRRILGLNISCPAPDYVKALEFENSSLDRLAQITKHFGQSLSWLEVYSIGLPCNFVEVLNSMPNLAQIKIQGVKSGDKNFIKGEVKLHNLWKIEIYECGLNYLSFFNDLPDGVLQELQIGGKDDSIENDFLLHMFVDLLDADRNAPAAKIKFFQNQQNIKKIAINKDFADNFEWSQVKLEEIDFTRSFSYSADGIVEKMLSGQNEVETFTMYEADNILLNGICSKLQSLVYLTISDFSKVLQGPPELFKLPNLKYLDLTLQYLYLPSDIPCGDVNNFLSLLRHKSLEHLIVSCKDNRLTELTMTQIGLNFPQLKSLQLVSKSPLNIINAIFQNCENLKSLTWYSLDSEVYKFQEGLSHDKLEFLQLEWCFINVNDEFLKLFGCCESLKHLTGTLALSEESLIEIFKMQPNLTTFRVHTNKSVIITQKVVNAIKENGNKLEWFRLSPCTLSNEIKPEMFTEEFKALFEIIKISNNRLEMKNE